MGRDQGRRETQGHVVQLGGPARSRTELWEHVRATKVNKDDVTSNIGNAAQALQQAA